MELLWADAAYTGTFTRWLAAEHSHALKSYLEKGESLLDALAFPRNGASAGKTAGTVTR